MKHNIKKYIIAVISVIILVFLDQWSKWLAISKLNPQNGGSDVIIWDGVFRLHYLENRGAAFGMLQGQKIILIAVTIIIFLAVCWIFTRIPDEKKFLPLQWICIFVLAGAVGNFIDRMRFSFVVDFFYFELINFPIFNVADIYVTCSVILFIILFIFYYKEADLDRIFPKKKEAA